MACVISLHRKIQVKCYDLNRILSYMWNKRLHKMWRSSFVEPNGVSFFRLRDRFRQKEFCFLDLIKGAAFLYFDKGSFVFENIESLQKTCSCRKESCSRWVTGKGSGRGWTCKERSFTQ